MCRWFRWRRLPENHEDSARRNLRGDRLCGIEPRSRGTVGPGDSGMRRGNIAVAVVAYVSSGEKRPGDRATITPVSITCTYIIGNWAVGFGTYGIAICDAHRIVITVECSDPDICGSSVLSHIERLAGIRMVRDDFGIRS